MKLSDQFNGDDNQFGDWDEIAPAPDPTVLPRGIYECRVAQMEQYKTFDGKPSIRFVLTVIEGAHKGRRIVRYLSLTPLAKPFTKRDLMKIGIDRPEKLGEPYPKRARLQVEVVVYLDNTRIQRNRVIDWCIMRIDLDDGPGPIAPKPDDPGGALPAMGDAFEGDGPYAQGY